MPRASDSTSEAGSGAGAVASRIAAPPAGLWRRLGALLYDALALVAIWMATLFIWVAAGDGQAVTGWPVQLVLLLECAGFYAYFWRRAGQTIGMRAWRLKLVNTQGGSVSTRAIAIRLLVAPLSLALFGAGYLWLLFNRNDQTLHDALSDTYVVLLPKPD